MSEGGNDDEQFQGIPANVGGTNESSRIGFTQTASIPNNPPSPAQIDVQMLKTAFAEKRNRFIHPIEIIEVVDHDNEIHHGFPSSKINDILNEATEKTELLFSSACIYRVLKNLRKWKTSAYTPQVITIGPIHGFGRLKTPREYAYVKRYYANNLFLRLTEGIRDQEKSKKKLEVLQECLEEMEKNISKAKKCYAEANIELDAMMMLFDGCFILELLYRYYVLMQKEKKTSMNGGDIGISKSKAWSSSQEPHVGEDTNQSSRRKQGMIDPIHDIISLEKIIRQGLLLLENQIPFFVLQKSFELTVEKIQNCPHKHSLTDYVLFYFRNTLNPEGNSAISGSKATTLCSPNEYCVIQISSGEPPAGRAKPYHHILHLLHDNFLPRGNLDSQGPGQNKNTDFTEFTLSASNLAYAGVRFEPLSGKNLFNVKFNEHKGLTWWVQRASLQVPPIKIHDLTEPLLRNLIAYEQCCPGIPLHFSSYAFLMDMLVKSEKDVRVLCDANVMYNHLGSDEDVSKMFNRLCKEVVLDDFYFADQCSKASKYSEYGWPKFMAYWKSTYFSSPWAFIGFCVAFIAFAISVTQFVYGFFHH